MKSVYPAAFLKTHTPIWIATKICCFVAWYIQSDQEKSEPKSEPPSSDLRSHRLSLPEKHSKFPPFAGLLTTANMGEHSKGEAAGALQRRGGRGTPKARRQGHSKGRRQRHSKGEATEALQRRGGKCSPKARRGGRNVQDSQSQIHDSIHQSYWGKSSLSGLMFDRLQYNRGTWFDARCLQHFQALPPKYPQLQQGQSMILYAVIVEGLLD